MRFNMFIILELLRAINFDSEGEERSFCIVDDVSNGRTEEAIELVDAAIHEH